MSEGQPNSGETKKRISHDTLGNEYVGGEPADTDGGTRIDPLMFDEPGVPGGFPRDAAGREILGATRKMKSTDREGDKEKASRPGA